MIIKDILQRYESNNAIFFTAFISPIHSNRRDILQNTIPFHPNPHPSIPPEPIHLQAHLPPFDPDWWRPKDTEQTYCSDSVVWI